MDDIRWLVIGVGNEFRGDDAVALHIIRRLHADDWPPERIIEATGDSAALIDLWGEARAVVIVDAVVSGARAGTIHWLDMLHNSLDPELFASSTHAFGVREALELGRLLKRLPDELILCGIEGSDFNVGQEMTAAVAEAVGLAASRIQRWIRVQEEAGDPAPL